jgi:phage major head subunit gpT-like protein
MLIRTQFPDLFLASMLPALDELIFNKYDRWPPQFTQIFRMMTSKRSIEQTSEIAGLGTFAVVGEGENVRYDEAVPGFNKTYVHAQYGLGFKLTRIMVDDDKWGIINKLASDLGRSAKETREIFAAGIFNNGFDTNYPGPDGKPLFATDHPIVKTNGVQPNTLAVAADLDIASLELALTDFRKMKDPSGKKIRLRPSRLVVPPDLEFVSSEIMNAKERSDTANHTPNAFKNRIGMPSFDQVVVWDYLTDPDAWFITAEPSETELRFYDREAFNTVHDVDFDSRSIKTAGWMRFTAGWSSFYGVYGSPGA